jgi:hypothetical protein
MRHPLYLARRSRNDSSIRLVAQLKNTPFGVLGHERRSLSSYPPTRCGKELGSSPLRRSYSARWIAMRDRKGMRRGERKVGGD